MDLDGHGVDYVNSRLKGGGVISRALLQKNGPVDKAYSPLPEDAASSRPLRFEHGGITSQRATLRWLASHIASQFPNRSDFCFLVEDSWAKSTDSSIFDVRQRILLAADTVIYAISGEDFDSTGLSQLFRSVSSFDYTGFLISCHLPGAPRVRSPLSDDVISQLVQQVRFVVVSAFDREGLVISEVEPREGSSGNPF